MRSGRTPSSPLLRRLASLPAVAVLVLAPPGAGSELSAQESTDDPHWGAMVVGGAHGLGSDGTHAYVGLEGGRFAGRMGAKGLAQYGTGNGFRSLAVGGGPAFRVVDLGFASLTAYGGVGWYREEEATSRVARDMVGLFGAAKARVPTGFGSLGLTLSLWHGRQRGPEMAESITGTPRRVSVGFGF